MRMNATRIQERKAPSAFRAETRTIRAALNRGRHRSLVNQSAQRSGFDRTVHKHGDRPGTLSHDNGGACLAALFKPKPTQGAHGIGAVNVTRKFQATATVGSWTKCRRIRAGASLSAK